MADYKQDATIIAAAVVKGNESIDTLISHIGGSSRRLRQMSASALQIIAQEEPKLLVSHYEDLIDALDRPEAQTRWELLDAMTLLLAYEPKGLDQALSGAETSLFDEESGPVRLAALRFLCRYGAQSAQAADKVWPLLDEAIQCYHGDYEFSDMLVALTQFSTEDLSDTVKDELKERMSFDAENSKGALKKRAQQIIDNLG